MLPHDRAPSPPAGDGGTAFPVVCALTHPSFPRKGISMTRLFCIGLAAVFALSAAQANAQTAPSSDDEKTLYAIGMVLARNLEGLGLSTDELKMVEAGLADAALGKDSKVDLAVYGPRIQTFAQSRMASAAAAEKEASAAFISEMKSAKKAQVSDSGLIYFELDEGDGANPVATDTVSVHYTGTLKDGTVFDSSVERGEPATFQLNRVIPCWTEGLQKMKVGGKAKLICPSEIAYGDQGAGDKIKPGAVLVFEVELLSIQ